MNEKILVVEDEDIEREILISYLEIDGFACSEAANGTEALELLKQEIPDLVLLDVKMPVMNGFETLQAMRQNPNWSQIPVIFLTSMDRDNLRIRSLELGAVHYLTKPYNKAVLPATVRNVLRRKILEKKTVELSKPQSGTSGSKKLGMEGNLADFPLLDLIQALSMRNKPALINLLESEGEFLIQNNQVGAISLGEFQGQEAFSRLLLLATGRFEVQFLDFDRDFAGESFPVMPFIMDATRIMDEFSVYLDKLPPLETQISFAFNEIEDEHLCVLQKFFPAKLSQLLLTLPGSLENNIKLFTEYKNHLIV